MIAQEVGSVFPDLVKTDRVTGMKAVQYANLLAPLIEAVKELSHKFDERYLSQEAKIQSLEQRMIELQTRLDKLEQTAK